MSGWRTLGTLALILFATAVLPPLGAFAVNRARVGTADAVVRRLAETARQDLGAAGGARAADVVCGAGRMPLARSRAAQRWVTSSRGGWDSAGNRRPVPPPDPWGNCYLVNLSAAGEAGAVVWVLSAGPDGIIDTAFAMPAGTAGGDDVRAPVR